MANACVPDSNRKGKLIEKLQFIGYSLQTKAYRLIDENTSRVIICRDVIFSEFDFNQNKYITKEIHSFEDDVFPEESVA